MDRRTTGVVLAGFCTFLNLYAPQAILPTLAAEFGVDLPHSGLTITASLIAVAVVAPFAGVISDRLGRKRLVVAAALMLTAPTAALAATHSLQAMLILRFVQGLLLPFIFAVTVAYIADECDGPDAIRTAGAYAVGTITAGFLGRFITGVASDVVGWRGAFLVLATMTCVAALGVALFLPRERRFRPQTGGVAEMLSTYADHATNAALLATCVVGFGMLFSMVAMLTFVNFYLAAPPFSLSPAYLGFVFAVYLLGIATTPLATRLAVRIGRRRTLAMSLTAATAGLMATMVPSIVAVIAGLAATCAGLFVAQALSLSFIGATVRRAKSTAVGLYVTVYYVGGALGGIAPAGVWRTAGWPGVVAIIVGAMSFMIVAAWAFWREPSRP